MVRSRDQRTVARRVLGWLGLALLVAILPFYAASGLLAPQWAVIVLLLVWVALFVTGVMWLRTRPWWVLVLPVAAVAVWFGGIYSGEKFLGWTG